MGHGSRHWALALGLFHSCFNSSLSFFPSFLSPTNRTINTLTMAWNGNAYRISFASRLPLRPITSEPIDGRGRANLCDSYATVSVSLSVSLNVSLNVSVSEREPDRERELGSICVRRHEPVAHFRRRVTLSFTGNLKTHDNY